MVFHCRVLTCGAVLVLSVCASPSPESMADWRHGAKHAWVVAVPAPEVETAQLSDCLPQLSKADQTTRRLVKVRYWHVRQTFYTIAELPSTLQANVGDEVELWPADCAQGRISQVSRKLAPRPG